MKIGYACINQQIECSSSRTFRLRSYSETRLIETVRNNLSCFKEILHFNKEKGLLFFRISSEMVPFASHPINQFPWQNYFSQEFLEVGDFIKENQMRMSMHPDQFTLINSPNEEIFERSMRELAYHIEILDLLELDNTNKVQIHIGGIYGEKEKSLTRFIERYKNLPEKIKKRLVIENDDRLYNLSDCLKINKQIGIPIVFDNLHHELNNQGESLKKSFELFSKTWGEKDGLPMVDYSQQDPSKRVGSHIDHINLLAFEEFIKETKDFNFDMVLEVKDKEASALEAKKIIDRLR